jgi:hypothetical protein
MLMVSSPHIPELFALLINSPYHPCVQLLLVLFVHIILWAPVRSFLHGLAARFVCPFIDFLVFLHLPDTCKVVFCPFVLHAHLTMKLSVEWRMLVNYFILEGISSLVTTFCPEAFVSQFFPWAHT